MLMIKMGRRYRAATKSEILEAASRVHVQNVLGMDVASPNAAKALFANMLGGRDHEVFVVALLDSRHRLIACEELFRGTIDGASVHPREVVKVALMLNAAAVIFAHNHPSGVTDPSQADELITRRLREALALIDVRVLDHMIVGNGSVLSFSERGLI
jgi:DNA repair protein RadC